MTAIKQNSVYLENEHSIPLYPSLAHAFGVPCAIILQQIRYWMKNFRLAEERLGAPDRQHFHEGRWWVYNTYEQWQHNNFGFWSKRTIQRHITALENMGVLLSAEFNRDSGDRTKWYTIDFDAMDRLVEQKQEELKASSQSVEMVSSTCPHHLDKVAPSIYKESETTTETTTENEDSGKVPSGDQQDTDPKPVADKPVQPHVAIIDAWWQSKPKTVRDEEPNYRRNVAVATRIIQKGYTPDQVGMFVEHHYRDKWWQDKDMTLEFVERKLKAWLLKNKPQPKITVAPMTDAERDAAAQSLLLGKTA